jgi:hypothetical protein
MVEWRNRVAVNTLHNDHVIQYCSDEEVERLSYPESIECFIEDHVFLPTYDLAPIPSPVVSLPRFPVPPFLSAT